MSDLDILMRLMQAMKDGSVTQEALQGLLRHHKTLVPLAEAFARGDVKPEQLQRISGVSKGENPWFTCLYQIFLSSEPTQEFVDRVVHHLRVWKKSSRPVWNDFQPIVKIYVLTHVASWEAQSLAEQLILRVRGLCGEAVTLEEAERILGDRFFSPERLLSFLDIDLAFTQKELSILEVLPWTTDDLCAVPDDAVLFPWSPRLQLHNVTELEYSHKVLSYLRGHVMRKIPLGWKLVSLGSRRYARWPSRLQDDAIPGGHRRSYSEEVALCLLALVQISANGSGENYICLDECRVCLVDDNRTSRLSVSMKPEGVICVTLDAGCGSLPLTRLPNPDVTSLT